MSSHPVASPSGGSLIQAFATQMRVIGALMMRELHTRYGRENVGYVWLIGEPLMLASVIGALHTTGHTAYGSDMKPLPFAVIGYTIFIMFRGIVNRSEGGLEANLALLYHRMVTVLDIVTARAVLEVAGVFLALLVLMTILVAFGAASPPARPLYLIGAIAFMFWLAYAHSLVITAFTHENRTAGRFVHPYTYFMIPASGAFFQIEWIPHPYREFLQWLPLPHVFELARYGEFRSANLDYFDGTYLAFVCAFMTLAGLIGVRLVRHRVHLQ